MGLVSTSEDIEKRKADTLFCEHEPVSDLKAALIAAVEPRKFDRRSRPAPRLKKSKKQLAAEKDYREREFRRSVAYASESEIYAEIIRLKAENDELRSLLKMRIKILEGRTKRR